ncbi:hypothetical protein DRJ17_01505 [Candidatus Woesearchaeota archaeon]|nr:MAG: hypothetical protein DRJ17_01505 [Candidatus Woesearchaeota archaeon]
MFKKSTKDLILQLKQKEKELSILYTLDDLRDSAKTLQDFLNPLLKEVVKTAEVEMGFILLVNEETDELEIAAVNDKGLYLFKGERFQTIKNFARRSINSCEVFIREGGVFRHPHVKLNSILSIPLVINRKAIGAIVVINKRKGRFNEHDIRLLKAIASQADSAIEHIKAVERVKQKVRELTIITEIDRIRDKTHNLNEMMVQVLDVVAKFIPVDYSAVIIVNEKSQQPEIVATKDRTKGRFSNGFVLKMAKDAMKMKKDLLLKSGKVKSGKAKNGFVMPIIFGEDKVFGAVVLLDKKIGFSDNDKALLHVLEDQLDSALEYINVFNSMILKNKELQVLYRIDEIRDNIKDFDKMLSAVLKEFVDVTAATIGFIILYDDDGKEKEMKTIGAGADRRKHIMRKIGYDAIKTASLISRNEVSKDIRSILCIPLILADKVIGTFGVINPKGKKHFDVDDEKLLTAVASQADTAIFEDISKQKIKNVFKRYVNEKVVEQMLKIKNEQFLTGQRLNMTVSFADIRGFTAMSEKLKDPEKLVKVINEYLTAMTEVVMAHDGTLDKFVGDEVMSLFGAPVHYPQHAKIAIETAIDMQKAMKRLQTKWKKEGKIPCKIGIGINTGEMVAGNIGCEKMSDYTVLGDNVNLGARLCSAAKGDQILVSEYTYKEAKRYFKFKKLEPIMVKGKSKPINVYEVIY